MPEWEDEKFQGVLTPSIWKSNAQEVKRILEMPEWEDEKFQRLSTPNIWNRKAQEVKEILEMPEWEDKKFQGVLTSSIWNRKAQELRTILEMPEWEDKKFQGLLTPTIWTSNVQKIKQKLHMTCWNDPRYQHLLTPTIFAITTKNITEGIKLLEEYGISEYITTRSLRRDQKKQRALINYMLHHQIDLIVEDDNTREKRINPMLNASNPVLKKRYNIDIDQIYGEYLRNKGKSEHEGQEGR